MIKITSIDITITAGGRYRALVRYLDETNSMCGVSRGDLSSQEADDFVREFKVRNGLVEKSKSLDRHGRITHFKDWKGKTLKVQYPRGETCAVVGAVSLIRTGQDRYAVVYGLQIKKGLNWEAAASEFGNCVIHQAECDRVLS